MSSTKEFFELIAKDKDVRLELGIETLGALTAFLKEKGLEEEGKKVCEAVAAKVAKAHGFDLSATEELSEEEMKAVAGGKTHCHVCYYAFTCFDTED